MFIASMNDRLIVTIVVVEVVHVVVIVQSSQFGQFKPNRYGFFFHLILLKNKILTMKPAIF